MGISSTILYPLCPRQTRIIRSSWTTRSTCFTAVLMWPPTHPSACVLSLTCLPLPYPSSQLWLSTSGMRGTPIMTGQLPVLLHLTILNCKQSQMEFVRPMMSDWRTYIKYMSSPTPQTHSVSPWTHLITWDNTCPSPFVRCWCPGFNTIHFHHITDGMDLEDHQPVHILTTLNCIQAGRAPVISADFARCRAVTQMLNG
jgi:hypothetical protein